MVTISCIKVVQATSEKLHPKAKLLFCFRVELEVCNSFHAFQGYAYDRPYAETDDMYGLIKMHAQDIPKGNRKAIDDFVGLTSVKILSRVYSEVFEFLHDGQKKVFPIELVSDDDS